jgi:hypothetical protein
MSYTVHDYLIRDTETYLTYNASQELIAARIDRSYVVADITDATDNEVVNAAVLHIQNNVCPVGTIHPRYTQANAQNYRGIALNSQTAAEVVVSFVYNFGGIPTTYQIEISSGLQGVTTNAEFNDDNSIKPLFVDYYVDWKDPNLTPTPKGTIDHPPASMQVLRPVQTISITKNVTETRANGLEGQMGNYVGFVNSQIFRSHPVGTVLCTGITTSAAPFQGQFLARLNFGFRPETWDEYCRVTNTIYGPPTNIWLAGTGFIANGIKKARAYPRTDLNALVTYLGT